MQQQQAEMQEQARNAEHARNLELEQVRVGGKVKVAELETEAKKKIADIRDDGDRDISDMKEKAKLAGMQDNGKYQSGTQVPNTKLPSETKGLDELLG